MTSFMFLTFQYSHFGPILEDFQTKKIVLNIHIHIFETRLEQ